MTAIGLSTLLDDSYFTVETNGAITVTLPTAVGINGRDYTIKKMDSGATTMTVACTGGETIDGDATKTIKNQYTAIVVRSDNTNWVIV